MIEHEFFAPADVHILMDFQSLGISGIGINCPCTSISVGVVIGNSNLWAIDGNKGAWKLVPL